MKKILIAIVLVVSLATILFFLFKKDNKVEEAPLLTHRKGVAILMTGAAARIPQEAALLEELDRKGMLKDVVFISGVSSGALNAVMLNGILSKKISWYEYRHILYNLKNSDIFKYDHVHFPFDTSPARELYTKIVEKKLEYHTIGDLPIATNISITNIRNITLKKTVFRMCSRKINEETDTTLNLVDILMATSAFPIVFPPQQIKNAVTIPNLEYIDGGVGDDQIPFHALLQFEKHRGIGVEKVYIISRKSDNATKISQELNGLGIDDDGVFKKLNISADSFLKRGIVKRMEAYATEAPELVPLTYVWIPDFENDFLLFNFNNLKEQYELTTQWARKNKPTPLAEYLLPYVLNRSPFSL
jgi:predicted acylesterase/phospholipase RssA